jgi:CRP/FNR family transcriptional regulator
MWAMQQILFMSMDKRLAVFLWDELSKTQGDTVRLTHEQIARYIGSAREVVSRMLKYFASEGIVELSRGGIRILDKGKLRGFI